MKVKRNFIENILITLGAIFLNIYIFLGHFVFPFSTTTFLYIGVICLILSIFFKLKINFDKGIFYYFLILFITFFGCLYTMDLSNAKRQLTFFLIYGLIYFVVKQKNEMLSKKFAKTYHIFSIMILISVYIQFIFPSTFNLFLSKTVSPKMYLTIMQSFNIDKSYVGISPSVTVTSFSLGILMFSSGIKILSNFFENKKNKSMNNPKKNNKINIIIFILSLFGIIITNKRGIFISAIIAFFATLIINKEISLKNISKNKFFILVSGIIFASIIGIYVISTNQNITHFINRFSGGNLLTGRDVFYTNAINDLNKGGLFSWVFGMGTGSAYVVNETALHNVYLQIIYDHGIIGLFIFLLYFIYNLKYSIKRLNNESFIQLAVQITFLVYCMSGNPLYSYYIMIPYLIFCVYKTSGKEDFK